MGDHDLELSTGGAIFPVMMMSFAIGIPIGMKSLKFFGSATKSCIIGGIAASATVFASSYTT